MTYSARKAFDRALPDGSETRLLRSLHLPVPRAGDAWDAFRGEAPDLVAYLATGRPGRKALVPLVYDAVRERELAVEAHERIFLKSAYLRETRRARRYGEILSDALAALTDADVAPALLKGTAFGLTLYRKPGLRHSHDIELMVRRDALSDAVRSLGSAGAWRPAPELAGPKGAAFLHGSGLPILLWTDPFRSPLVEPPVQAFWERSRHLRSAGPGARVLSPADHLLLVLGNAAFSQARESLLWACDAVRLLEQTEVDWAVFSETAGSCGLRIPAYRMTEYLRRELEAAVPEAVVETLERRSRRVSRLERDAALRAARVGSGDLAALAESASGAADRLRFLCWTFFPSGTYVRRLAGPHRGSPLALLYARRLARYVRVAAGRRISDALHAVVTSVRGGTSASR